MVAEVTPKVETPETLSCFENNVAPVTVVIPAKVERPEILTCCDVRLVVEVTPKVLTPVAFKLRVVA